MRLMTRGGTMGPWLRCRRCPAVPGWGNFPGSTLGTREPPASPAVGACGASRHLPGPQGGSVAASTYVPTGARCHLQAPLCHSPPPRPHAAPGGQGQGRGPGAALAQQVPADRILQLCSARCSRPCAAATSWSPETGCTETLQAWKEHRAWSRGTLSAGATAEEAAHHYGSAS